MLPFSFGNFSKLAEIDVPCGELANQLTGLQSKGRKKKTIGVCRLKVKKILIQSTCKKIKR